MGLKEYRDTLLKAKGLTPQKGPGSIYSGLTRKAQPGEPRVRKAPKRKAKSKGKGKGQSTKLENAPPKAAAMAQADAEPGSTRRQKNAKTAAHVMRVRT